MTIRVLLVDDSAVIRGLMDKALSEDGDIHVVGTAANGEMAINAARQHNPDVIILDIEMPVMDGITALPELLKVAPNCKIIMASTLTQRNAEISIKALTLGAADYLAKPSAKFGNEVEAFYRELIGKIHGLCGSVPKHVRQSPLPSEVKVPISAPVVILPSSESPLQAGIKALAIASSTGGPQALLTVFEHLSGHLNHIPIFLTQHMPPTFTAILADHLEKAGKRKTVEAADGMVAQAGCAYVAPGDYHMVAEKQTDKIILHTNQDKPENFCRPAADPMLRSLGDIYGRHLLVLVLTGMGQDGLEGAKYVVNRGGHIIAQDAATSVVYGMPKAVAENKLCKAVLPLPEIGRYLIQQIEGR